jgi:orotidine-5'-phosphate decarboxylase
MSAVGAVVGATVPEHLVDLRERMPDQPFLLPGVGAQGGRPEDLAPVFAGRPAAALVTVSRGIMLADDPAAAAEDLRRRVREAAA